MKDFVRPLILIAAVGGVAYAQSPQEQSGAYVTYKFSQRLATETYTIWSRAGEIQEQEAESEVAGQQSVKATTRVAANKPASFSEEVGGTRLFSGEYSATGLKIQAPGKPELEVKSRATVILENLVAHHYILLLGQYDGSKGGRQDFVASLPSEARDLAISVEHRD